MELTVAKADLQKELQLCQGVVEKRSTIPILSNVLLKAADGRLQIAATDLDVTILSSCAARVTTPGGVTIEAKRLFDIVRSLPDEDVHITLQENNSLLVESGTAKFRLLGLPAEDYPTLPTVNATESYDIPLDELKTMVGQGEVRHHARGDALPAQRRAAQGAAGEDGDGRHRRPSHGADQLPAEQQRQGRKAPT